MFRSTLGLSCKSTSHFYFRRCRDWWWTKCIVCNGQILNFSSSWIIYISYLFYYYFITMLIIVFIVKPDLRSLTNYLKVFSLLQVLVPDKNSYCRQSEQQSSWLVHFCPNICSAKCKRTYTTIFRCNIYRTNGNGRTENYFSAKKSFLF